MRAEPPIDRIAGRVTGLVRFSPSSIPVTVLTVSLLARNLSLSEATRQVDDVARDIGLPDTMNFSFQGTAQELERSLRGLTILPIIAVLVIYLVKA